jgi:hypothetical protein
MLLDGNPPKLPPNAPTASNAKQESTRYKELVDRSIASTGF